MKITCVSKSVSGQTLRYQLESDSTYLPIIRGLRNNRLFGFVLWQEDDEEPHHTNEDRKISRL